MTQISIFLILNNFQISLMGIALQLPESNSHIHTFTQKGMKTNYLLHRKHR